MSDSDTDDVTDKSPTHAASAAAAARLYGFRLAKYWRPAG